MLAFLHPSPFLFCLMAIYYAATFCVADHGTGGGFDWAEISKVVPGRSLYWYGVAAALSLFFFVPLDLGWRLALVALGWVVYRSFAWKLFGGQLDPQNLRQDMGYFARHMLILIPVAVAFLTKLSWQNMLICSPFYAVAAVLLGMWIASAARPGATFAGHTPPGRDVVPQTEMIRGALFGLMLSTALLPPLF